jgi:MFS transporter, SHS family, lactate transporter
METVDRTAERANQRNALLAGTLGWTLDAFDFFLLAFVLVPVAHDFHVTVPAVAAAFGASLLTRWLGALLFGLLADHYGRRRLLILNIIYYSLIEVLSGLAPNYRIFFILRLLYGIGMGGEWGVGASLVMESVPARWRGVFSGLLQEGYAMGELLAAVTYALVFPHWGWRMLFFVGGLPALLTLFVAAKVEEPRAWLESKTDWKNYRRSIVRNWKLFLYLVVLMTMANLISHGTQDLYPTFLQKERQLSASLTSLATAISMVGAILGGLAFGFLSDRWGRRRAMVSAVLSGLLVTPLWILAPRLGLILLGAFLMQFMVQGSWGVIPAHLIELSPGPLRAFFPGFAYQLGVVASAGVSYFEARLAQRFSYAVSMGILAVAVLIMDALVVAVGPEAKGIRFGKGET